MTQAFNLAQLANNLNTSGQLDATDGLNGLVANANLASSGTASSTTFLRGDRTWSTLGNVGKVLQVQNLFFSTIVSTSTRTFTNISGFSVNITPSSSTSKILILGQVSGVASAAGGYELGFRVTRNGTSVGQNTNGTNYTAMSQIGTMAEGATTVPLIYLDSPGTTSALTYQVQWIAGEAATYYLNAAMSGIPIDTNAYNTSGASSLMLLEIGA